MSASGSDKRISFWRRLWLPEPDHPLRSFDFIFGIAAPILCLYFDPIVFRGDGCYGPILGRVTTFAYVGVGLEVALLAIWLVFSHRLGTSGDFVAGVFGIGAVVSFGVGLVILPFSLIGILLLGLGLLGFIPFLTAIVYWRNSRIAWLLAREKAPKRLVAGRLALLVLGIAVAVGISTGSQVAVSRLFPQTVLTPQECPSSVD